MGTIAGTKLSAIEIEHAVIRAKNSKPNVFGAGLLLSIAKFKVNDDRSDFCIENVEPLVNFALSYGTASSPLIHVYKPENLTEQLNASARTFCHNCIKINRDTSTVTLPKIFEWYRKDIFARTSMTTAELQPSDDRRSREKTFDELCV